MVSNSRSEILRTGRLVLCFFGLIYDNFDLVPESTMIFSKGNTSPLPSPEFTVSNVLLSLVGKSDYATALIYKFNGSSLGGVY